MKYTSGEIYEMLSCWDEDSLFSTAYGVKLANVGNKVSLRGLIEFSNICSKDCLYCGIRCGNKEISRYRMSEEDVLTAAQWAAEARCGSIVIQSGEMATETNTAAIERILSKIHAKFGDDLGITLSLGEQSEDTYKRWKEAGAHRYLLRIESSNPGLYARIHPAGHSWEFRLECLKTLKRLGYIVGSGVMIGIPGQTLNDLVDDIVFFEREDLDMIGMGPFIPHPKTPLGFGIEMSSEWRHRQVNLGLRMIAATRLCLNDVNIASTTALQALDPNGRELGLKAGANVIMPNITPPKYRGDYNLYADKPNMDEYRELCAGELQRRFDLIGEEVNWDDRGDSIHWQNRILRQERNGVC